MARMRVLIRSIALLLSVSSRALTQTLLRGGTFITYDSTDDNVVIVRNGAMLFDDKIIGISNTPGGLDAKASSMNANVVNTTGKIISPGFIDTHRHTWQTAMRTTGPNIQLERYAWTFGTTGPPALDYSPDDVFISELMGNLEGLNAGVTTTVDYAHMTWSRAHAEAALKGAVESGARIFFCYEVMPVTVGIQPYTLNASAQTDQLAHIEEIAGRGVLGDGLVTLSIAFDGFGFGGPIATQVLETASKIDAGIITAHYVGGVFGFGENAIENLNNQGALNTSQPFIFAHASFLTPSEIQILRSTNQHISITPESEMHYGHGHPHSFLIQDQASLGVDTHFTFSIDILTQMRLWLQSVRLQLYQLELDQWQLPSDTPMTVQQAFLMGTRNGGLALNRTDLGVLEVGAVGDVVVFDPTGSIGLIGWSDPIAAIVLHSNVGDIEEVYVGGKIVKKDKKLVRDWQGEGLKGQLESAAERWRETLRTVNLTAFEEGVLPFVAVDTGKDFVPPFRVDVSPGETNGTEEREV